MKVLRKQTDGKHSYKLSFATKTIMVFVPILIASLFLSGYFSSITSKRGMTRIAMRFMAYKAEELKKYTDNQWELLVENKLAGNEVFVTIAKEAVFSYADTIMRSATENVFAVSPDGEIELSTEEITFTEEEKEMILQLLAEEREGWIEINLENEDRVGHMFYSPQFEWFIFLTELEEVFYREVNELTVQQLIIIVISAVLAAFFLILFSHFLIRPVRNVAEGMRRIVSTKDFSEKVEVEYSDEIGVLAHEFNIMSDNLNLAYEELKNKALSEMAARKDVSAREIETLKVLGRATDYRDPETGAHVVRVGLYSRLMAKLLGCSQEEQDLILLAAPLHDIGKLGTPDSVLLKDGKLTKKESEIMKRHTTISTVILRDVKSTYLQAGAAIGISHHEHYDGRGYPKGLKGEEIPLFGRIVGIADVFDSLLSKRPYKEAWTIEKALAYIKEQRGKQFDPEIVDLFLSHADQMIAIFNDNQDEFI